MIMPSSFRWQLIFASFCINAAILLLVAILGGLSYGLALLLAIFLSVILGPLLHKLFIHQLRVDIAILNPGINRFSLGQLETRLKGPALEPLVHLAQALNTMATKLRAVMARYQSEKSEAQAVLECMTEGVIAVDNDERLLNINPAATKLLGIEDGDVRGRNILEVVRNSALHEFMQETLRSKSTTEGRINLIIRSAENSANSLEGTVQLHGTPLKNHHGETIGALGVLSDITKISRVDTMRKDFVANVSHELRTPITSIKGFVETLQDGALDSPEDAKKFLGIIARQAERLGAIIDDMLQLSSIEEQGTKTVPRFERNCIADVMLDAKELCEFKARQKGVTLRLNYEEGLFGTFNAPLIEQALTNLINNAIEYSSSGQEIVVGSEQETQQLLISVSDSGTGISEEQLPRIFERFYRVDRARSRKSGGTGLGLAIVKHIMQLHGGEITVKSQLGKGTTFTLRLPNQE